MSDKKTVCLCMIVKDEEKDIERCLNSVKDHIDYWVISDTGSSDNTIDKINSLMSEYGIEGELHEHKWVDFATNRNNVIELARDKADYLWMMDADDYYIEKEGVGLLDGIPEDEELFRLNFYKSGAFKREALMKASADINYHGVFHEFLWFNDFDFSRQNRIKTIENGNIIANSSPTKRAETAEKKYLQDAKILEKALKKESREVMIQRYTFYIAQSYENAKKYGLAIKWYKKRLDGFQSKIETYMSLFGIVKCNINLNPLASNDIISSIVDCWKQYPNRLEPIHVVVRHFLLLGDPYIAFMIADGPSKTAAHVKGDTLFRSDVYMLKFPILHALAAYMIEKKDIALLILNALLLKFKEEDEGYRQIIQSYIQKIENDLVSREDVLCLA